MDFVADVALCEFAFNWQRNNCNPSNFQLSDSSYESMNRDPKGCLFIDAGNQRLFVIVFQNDAFRLAQFFPIKIWPI